MQPQHAVDQHQPNPFLQRDSDFLRHPDNSPFKLRPLPVWQRWRRQRRSCDGLGLVCHSRQHLSPGTWLELVIPVRDAHEHFTARVVMVRETREGYDIGLRLASKDDGSRLRIVEQFCYMECFCRDLDNDLHSTGCEPRHEQSAQAWVEKFAAAFPPL